MLLNPDRPARVLKKAQVAVTTRRTELQHRSLQYNGSEMIGRLKGNSCTQHTTKQVPDLNDDRRIGPDRLRRFTLLQSLRLRD